MLAKCIWKSRNHATKHIISPPSLAITTNQGINESIIGANISINSNNMDFYAMFIILSIIIIMLGLINLRIKSKKS